MTLQVLRTAALPDHRKTIAQLADELLHPIAVALEGGVAGRDVGFEDVHSGQCPAISGQSGRADHRLPDTGHHSYHPQQSVLKPQIEQRQTACMRYISPSQRSQSILSTAVGAATSSSLGTAGLGRETGRGGLPRVGSDMRRIIAYGRTG